MDTTNGQKDYLLLVEPGVYHVVAYYQNLAGGYTQAVLCGLGENCSDHLLIPVTVKANHTVKNVDLQIVWDVVKRDILEIKPKIQRI